MKLNYGINSLEFDIVDGVCLAYMVYQYDSIYDRERFLELCADEIETIFGFDYTVFDDEDSIEVVFTLENREDFEYLRNYLEV